MKIETRVEAVAAMLADELEELVVDEELHDGIPLEKRKELVELIVRRFEYFYELGLESAKDAEPKPPEET